MELFKAANQWSTRPADERFWDIQDALEATSRYADTSIEKTVHYRDLRVDVAGPTGQPPTEVKLMGRSGVPARLSHWAFGQLAQLAGAPASYLRSLPPTLVAQNLNHGLKQRSDDAQGRMLFHPDGQDVYLRAITGDKYARIWNAEIFERLMDLRNSGWRVPPGRPAVADPRARPATEADVLRRSNSVGGLKIKVGDMIAPSGVYASGHDMFAFLINEERRIDDGSEDGLTRGVFFWNSEVGARSFGMQTFLLKAVCGNHIVWGASKVREIRIRHVGAGVRSAFQQVAIEMRRYADSSASEDEARITAAKSVVLGGTKDEVLEALFATIAKKRIPLAQSTLAEAYDLAEVRTADYGAANTAWAIGNALTEVSQRETYAEDRVAIDSAAGRLMSALVF